MILFISMFPHFHTLADSRAKLNMKGNDVILVQKITISKQVVVQTQQNQQIQTQQEA